MKQNIFRFFLFFFFLFIFGTMQAAEPVDTLLACKKAESLCIRSGSKYLSLRVENIEGSGENFYYDEKGMTSNDFTLALAKSVDPLDIVITDSGDSVTLSYTDKTGKRQTFTFAAEDSANRSITSYTGLQNDFGLKLSGSRNFSIEISTSGLGIGFATPVSSNFDMNISMGRSLEFNWLSVLDFSFNHGPHSVSAGLGLNWQKLETRGDAFFVKNPDRTIGMTAFADNQTERRSKFSFFSLQVPLLYKFRFGHHRDWHVNLGPIVNFNTGAHIKTSWREGDNKFTIQTGKIGQRPVTVDGFCAFGWQGLSIYARYSPMNRLRDYTGMKFGTFSTGVIFFL